MSPTFLVKKFHMYHLFPLIIFSNQNQHKSKKKKYDNNIYNSKT